MLTNESVWTNINEFLSAEVTLYLILLSRTDRFFSITCVIKGKNKEAKIPERSNGVIFHSI